jgi:hypothetical protein
MEMRIGMTFNSEFTKNRDDDGHHEKSIDWTFPTSNSHTNVAWRPTDTRELIYELIKNDMNLLIDIQLWTIFHYEQSILSGRLHGCTGFIYGVIGRCIDVYTILFYSRLWITR